MSPQELDSPWKELVDHDLPALLALLAPEVHADIDWTRDVESLEQELRKMAPTGETGKRLADKLLKATTVSGDERYLHVEVQGQRQAEFERRVYTYHYRGDDRFGLPPEAIIILADDDPGWRPARYVVQLQRTRLTFEFDPIKILDWAGRKEELMTQANPAALFVLAHLESLRTRDDDAERARVKLDLILRLHERKLDGEELRQWYRYLDWLLALSKDREKQVWQEVKRLEQEKKMPFITFAERHGMEIGMEKGLEQGMEKGLEQGMEKGLEKGLEKGREEAQREYLLKGIALGLKLKFRADAAAFLADLEPACDTSKLETVFNAIEGANGIDDLRKLIS